MSAAVGSTPSLTRSGRRSPSLRSSAPSGRQSTTLRLSQAAVSEGSGLTAGAIAADARARATWSSSGIGCTKLSRPPGKPRPSERYAGLSANATATAAAPSPWSATGDGLDRMSDDDDNIREPRDPRAPIPFAPPKRRRRRDKDGRRRKPKVRKLRLFWILFGLGALAVVSTIFGMMMAV